MVIDIFKQSAIITFFWGIYGVAICFLGYIFLRSSDGVSVFNIISSTLIFNWVVFVLFFISFTAFWFLKVGEYLIKKYL